MIVLSRGVVVTGVVVDAEGKPVRSARVNLGDGSYGTSDNTRTDKQGRFSFPHAKAGQMVLTAQASRHGPELVPILAAKDMSPVRIQLPKASTIRGRVVDPEGNPVPGTNVSADTWRGYQAVLRLQKRTDKDGRFVWRNAPQDAVVFSIYKQGYMRVGQRSLSPSDEEQTITMQRPLRVAGKVFDAETGKPIAKFSAMPGIGWGRGGSPHWERRSAKPFSDGSYELAFSYPYPEHYVRIEADGYKPGVSRMLDSDEGEVTIDFKLTKGTGPAGIVLTPDGSPATVAMVVIASPSQSANISNGKSIHHQGCPMVTTGPDGRYSFPAQEGVWALVVVHDSGYAEIPGDNLPASGEIRLEQWGRVEGKLLIGAKPGAGEKISVYQSKPYNRDQPQVRHELTATTDGQGAFSFPRVPPGPVRVGKQVKLSDTSYAYSHTEQVVIEPGQTVRVQLGGTGRPVVGQVSTSSGEDIDPGCNGSIRTKIVISDEIAPNLPKPPERPEDFENLDEGSKAQYKAEYELAREAAEEWRKTDEYKAYMKAYQAAQEKAKYFRVVVTPEGTFRTDDVPAGVYELTIRVRDPQMMRILATANKEFIVPEVPGGRSDEPLDIGIVELKTTKRPTAPVVMAEAPKKKTLCGKPLAEMEQFSVKPAAKLDSKYTLVCFWAMDQRPSRRCIKQLAARSEQLAKDGVAVVAIHAAPAEKEALSKWLAQQKVDLPIGQVPAKNIDKTLADWHVGSLPWLVLANKKNVVQAEGFGLDELDQQLGKLAD